MPRKRKGSPHWHYDFQIKGRRFRGSLQTDEKATALALETALKNEILLGQVTTRRPQLTLDAAFSRYWIEHGQHRANAETMYYQGKALLAGLGKTRHLDELTSAQLADYCARRRGTPSKRSTKTHPQFISDTSINKELSLLRAVLNRADRVWEVRVPTLNWSALWLEEPPPRERYLTVEEAERVLAAAAPHLRPAIELSLLTGIRLGNCLGLDWRQVDLSEATLHLTVKHKRYRRPLDVPLCGPAVVLLANVEPKAAGPVFTYRGRALRSARTAWKAALRRAGIEDFRWHDLRHTAASWMVQQEVPLDVVQRILGHASIQTTQRYAHREDSAQRAAVDKLASRLRHTPTRARKASS